MQRQDLDKLANLHDDDILDKLAFEKNKENKFFELAWYFDQLKKPSRALGWYTRAAALGHTVAKFNLSIYFLQGIGIKKNERAGFNYLMDAANGGHIQAQYDLSICFFNGTGIDKNDKKAVDCLIKAADAGHLQALYELSKHYLNGTILEENEAKGIDNLIKAADRGHAQALFDMACRLLEGSGFKKNEAKAIEHLTKAAEKGHADSQFHLGLEYYKGNLVEKNEKKSFEYFQLAAQQKHVAAIANLAYCFLKGIGTLKNTNSALSKFKDAADRRNTYAQDYCGYCFLNGIGTKKNYSGAVSYFKHAIEQGHLGAKSNLGYCFLKGLGLEKNYQEASDHFQIDYLLEKAKDKDDEKAQFNLGICYLYGIKINKDENKGLEYLKTVAENGCVRAQIELSDYYFKSSANKNNIELAIYYLHMAANSGDEDSQYNLGCRYLDGDGVEKNMQEAMAWLLKSSLENQDAQFKLAKCYLNTTGVDNEKQGIIWLQKAANNGHEEAGDILNNFLINSKGNKIKIYTNIYLSPGDIEQAIKFDRAQYEISIPASSFSSNKSSILKLVNQSLKNNSIYFSTKPKILTQSHGPDYRNNGHYWEAKHFAVYSLEIEIDETHLQENNKFEYNETMPVFEILHNSLGSHQITDLKLLKQSCSFDLSFYQSPPEQQTSIKKDEIAIFHKNIELHFMTAYTEKSQAISELEFDISDYQDFRKAITTNLKNSELPFNKKNSGEFFFLGLNKLVELLKEKNYLQEITDYPQHIKLFSSRDLKTYIRLIKMLSSTYHLPNEMVGKIFEDIQAPICVNGKVTTLVNYCLQVINKSKNIDIINQNSNLEIELDHIVNENLNLNTEVSPVDFNALIYSQETHTSGSPIIKITCPENTILVEAFYNALSDELKSMVNFDFQTSCIIIPHSSGEGSFGVYDVPSQFINKFTQLAIAFPSVEAKECWANLMKWTSNSEEERKKLYDTHGVGLRLNRMQEIYFSKNRFFIINELKNYLQQASGKDPIKLLAALKLLYALQGDGTLADSINGNASLIACLTDEKDVLGQLYAGTNHQSLMHPNYKTIIIDEIDPLIKKLEEASGFLFSYFSSNKNQISFLHKLKSEMNDPLKKIDDQLINGLLAKQQLELSPEIQQILLKINPVEPTMTCQPKT